MPTDMQPLCAVPFTTAFTNARGGYRNCCCTYPPLDSPAGQTISDWWQSSTLQQFRLELINDQLPLACKQCKIAEESGQESFRTSINAKTQLQDLGALWPSRWNIQFGNLCNLACWTCSENNSSVIEHHKSRLRILPQNFVQTKNNFLSQWPDLHAGILQSYQSHDTIELTILGGEPLYNPQVLDFLKELQLRRLSTRTRLEFHTNGTKFNQQIARLLDPGVWQNVCIFVSLDSIGVQAEWLRYGCRWPDIEQNLSLIQNIADYSEAHCTLSILNIMELDALKQFCLAKKLPLKFFLLAAPECMSLSNWDDDPTKILNLISKRDPDFEIYYSMIGTTAQTGTRDNLRQYIQQFDLIRKPLVDFNPKLHAILHG